MTSHPPRSAVVLLSGGLDSATCLAIAKAEGYVAHAVSFDYGQRHRVELSFAERLAERLQADSYRVLRVDLRPIGGSSLTTDLPVPKHRSADELGSGIPSTYVPARNTIFLSYGLALAEVLGANHLFIGVNALDYSGYPDCRPEFIESFERMANLATRAGVENAEPFRIEAPLQHLSKAEIILKARALGLDPDWTLSCYDPSPEGLPCGACDACLLRAKGMAQAAGLRA
ncbi:COG0603 Predicted PP-loop superfamily ATPase [Burkholderiales bacterium]